MSADFWPYFRNVLHSKLLFRAPTFQKAFEYLDSLDHPVIILETGCLRTKDAWGDGQSTWLFDFYAQNNDGSKVYSVDKDPEAVATATEYISDRTTVTAEDSVAYLSKFKHTPDLVYLDSYDLDPAWPLPSAIHHLKELTAIMPRLTKNTLVMVDDAVLEVNGFMLAGPPLQVTNSRIGGKARFVAEYAENVGAEPFFTSYQCGWLNLVRKS